MSAGTGITHSEFNPSKTQEVHLLQIWIVPEKKGIKLSYEQFALPKPDDKNVLQLIASHEGGKNIIRFYQDVEFYRGLMSLGKSTVHTLRPRRGAWIQMIKGTIDLNGVRLKAGDGAAIEGVDQITFKAQEATEFLLFDLA